MPRREDIEKFKEILNSLGGEPEIMSQRAQAIEEVAPPEEVPIVGGPPAGEGEPSAGPGEEPFADQDFGLDLTSLPEMPEEAAEAQPPAAAAKAPAPAGAPAAAPSEEGLEAGLDFSSLFAEESAAPPIQEIEVPPAGEEFQLPEAEAAALQSDLSQMEILPEEAPQEPGPGEAAAGEAPAGEELPTEALSFGDIGTFEPQEAEGPAEAGAEETGLPEAGLPEAGPPEAGPPEAGLSEEEMAGIELPNLEDLSLAEPTAGAPEEPVAEAGAPGPEAAEEAGLGGLEAGGAEEAPMPSLEGFDLGEAPGGEAPEQGAEGIEAQAPLEPGEALGGMELPSELPGEAPAAPPSAAPAEAPAEESLGVEGISDLGLDELSLPEAPEGLVAPAAPQEAPREEPTRRPAAKPARPARARPETPAAPAAAPIPELGGAEGEISLTPEQFARLKQTLDSLPRNVKIAAQDVIADGRAVGADLSKLIGLLVAGASAQEIAAVVGKITGTRIRIPAGYEKKTGVAFEAERRTFAYAFRENIVPLIRVFVLTILAAAIVGFLGYRYVYRPLFAATNYRVGYSHILGDRFTLANERFNRAVNVWPMKRWFFRYAEGFAEKRQYILAEEKYDQLLAQWPNDRKAILEYAGMESTRLADYKKADTLLRILLDKNQYDYDALLAAGDNNLEWAATDRTRFEAARVDYASLIEKYGERDELLFRMLRYFIRTDNGSEVERLRLEFASREGLKVDPSAYAELGGYLVDHRRLNYVKEILLKADAVKSELPEIHYNLARYYRLVDLPQDEMTALRATVIRMKPTDPLTPRRLAMEIDTHTRLGELYDTRGEYVNGEKELQGAIAMIEENQKNRLISSGPIFGRPYADLADLNYYVVGDMDTARSLYQKAIANGYFDPALDYKIGYTQYAAGDYVGALASFMKTEGEWGYPRDPDAPPPIVAAAAGTSIDYTGKPPANLLYSMGNTFYQRGDYFAAQGYYLRLLDRLEARQTAIGTLDPEDKPEHRALLEGLVKVNNNLGVVMNRLAARTGDRTRKSQALVYLADASQIADTLTRTPGGRTGTGPRNLPYLNQRGILYPVSGFVPQISRQIPKDLGALDW